jgi:catechol 2,3-dioxygenase-like lactoylglutathione lyase family enzyme
MDGVRFVGARPVLAARDPARSKVFWVDLLGFAAVVDREDYALLRGGDVELELRRDARPTQVSLEVRGLEALHAVLVDSGHSPGELHTHESARRTFTVRDPDGNVVLVAERARAGGRLAGLELIAPDPAAIGAFWRAVVGFDPGDDGLRADGRPTAGVTRGEPAAWRPSLTVDDLEAALAEVTARGGAIVSRRPGTAIVRDPAGAVATLIAPSDLAGA